MTGVKNGFALEQGLVKLLLPPKLNSKLQDLSPADKSDAYRKTGLLIAREVADIIDADGHWIDGSERTMEMTSVAKVRELSAVITSAMPRESLSWLAMISTAGRLTRPGCWE